jgi:hypothetical protein
MQKMCAIDEIKKKNDLLLEEINNRAVQFKGSLRAESFPLEFKRLLEQAEEFASEVEDFSKQNEHVSVSDYVWLNEIVAKWELVFSRTFHIKKEINISFPKYIDPLPNSEKKTLRQVPFSGDELRNWIQTKAFDLSKDRRLAFLEEKLRDGEGLLNFLLREVVISNKDEEHNDFYTALNFLASEILDGKINLVRQISPECYAWSLEDIWIKDVKKLKAYYNSKNRGNGCEFSLEDYSKACDQINQSFVGLFNPELKMSSEDFSEIKEYIENNYLTHGKVDPLDANKGRKLIVKKAKHIWESTRHLINPYDSIEEIHNRNWRWAEMFVRNFYENIIEAIENGDVSKTSKILSAFQTKEIPPESYSIPLEYHDLITNCFEAAIAIYFLSPELLSECQYKGYLEVILI